MRLIEVFRIAIESILLHKTRALLTMLGIIIGVGAVVAMLAVGTGARKAIEDQIASLGSNVLIVFPSSTFRGGVSGGAGSFQSLKLEDVDAIREQASAVAAITPSNRTFRQVIAGDQNWNTSIQGANTDYFVIRDWNVDQGTTFTDQDDRASTKVCVLGKTVAENLFPGESAVGQTIRIQNMPFSVIGILTSKGQNTMGQDQDDIIIAPFGTVQKKIQGEDHVGSLLLSAVSKDRIPDAQAQVKQILRIRHKLADWQDDDFTIRNQTEITAAMTSTSAIMTILLASIASVSLVVGGIGIMNIMLVSVTERTREIGIRKSLGARRRDVLQQFLFEAVSLSILGGIVGIALGMGTSSIISRFAGWPVTVTPLSVMLAFGFSAAVGVFFGYYPARKAAVLNPIDALRYE